MKKFLFGLLLLPCMLSFYSCERSESFEKAKAVSSTHDVSQPRRAPEILGVTYEPMLQNDYQWSRTALADAAGAKEGVEQGHLLGMIFELEKRSVFIGALVGAVYYSAIDAWEQLDRSTPQTLSEAIDRPFDLNVDIPFQPAIDNDLILRNQGEDYAVLGTLHNAYCTSVISNQIRQNSKELRIDSICQSVISAYKDDGHATIIPVDTIAAMFKGIDTTSLLTTRMLQYRDSLQEMNAIELFNYTNAFLDSIKILQNAASDSARCQEYTELMYVVSVMYHSVYLWNTNVPNPNRAYEAFVYNVSTGAIDYISGRTAVQHRKAIATSSEVFFYPVYRGTGHLAALYAFIDTNTITGDNLIMNLQGPIYFNRNLEYTSCWGNKESIDYGPHFLQTSRYSNGYYILIN